MALLRPMCAAVLVLVATQLSAQTKPAELTLFPGRTYDPAVPVPSTALGYSVGSHLATYAELVPYFEGLVRSSRRVKFASHAKSYEGRPIYNVTISSPENLARIGEIKANIARLADPRALSAAQADAIVRNTPLVIMLVFATDGAETAAPEAAMQVAYQLAAGTDAHTTEVLRNTVIVIVPAENPDANQRTVAWYNAFRVGPEGTADADAAEHNFPWGINSNNHYQIDPNRESVWSTTRETRAMVALYREWNPQVFVDNHGQHAQYTGPWYVEPLHEVLTEKQRDWHHKFGRAMQPEFAKRSYDYAPWEFGQFDPGYWDTYPNYSGAIAWTTETSGGGNRGIQVERRSGAPYTLKDGILQHVLASDVTMRLAAQNREQLLRDFYDYKRSAIEEGARGAVKAYAISSRNDPRNLATVVNAMRRNTIEVHRTNRELPLNNARPYFGPAAATLPAGSYILSTAQPESRMLRVLMEPEAKFSREFMEQIARAQASGSAGRLFYDITAWSIPHTYNLDAYELAEVVPANALTRVSEEVVPRGELVRPMARHGFVIDWGSNAAIQVVAKLRRDSIAYRTAPEPFTLDGKVFTAGSIIMLREDNRGRDLGVLARSIATESGVSVVGVDTPTTGSALRLDASSLARGATGRIAVVMDEPVSTSSYGHIWYTFEQRFGVDFTALNFDRLNRINLDKYEVLILPDGNYGSVHKAVASEVAAKLRAWVQQGGTLIGVRGASAWIAAEENGLTAARMRRSNLTRQPSVPGAVIRASVTDARHPLVSGYTDDVPVMVWSALAFDPAAPVEAPLRIAVADRAKVSGFVFDESLPHIAGSPYVVRERRGQGSVVLFLDDPNFRLFWDGLTRLFFNAVFLGDR